jgi:hypothetical protein
LRFNFQGTRKLLWAVKEIEFGGSQSEIYLGKSRKNKVSEKQTIKKAKKTQLVKDFPSKQEALSSISITASHLKTFQFQESLNRNITVV